MTKTSRTKLADTFAKFIVDTKFSDIDPNVLEHLKQLTLKQVMGTVVGAGSHSSDKLLRYIKDNVGKPECGVYGLGFKTDVSHAALMNGFSAHASEMEDDQFPGGGISDVTVWPAVLTMAQYVNLSGEDLLTAMYVGHEMQNRIAWWASEGTDKVGLLNLPFIGIYGATAACAKALKLDYKQTHDALGLAMVTGLGYVYEMGTDAHFWESALVCRNAVLNALMAQNGFTSRPAIEESLDRLTGGDKNIRFDNMLEGLGKAPYYATNTWIKKWGFCFSSHVYVDILADLARKENVHGKDIKEVAVHFDVNRGIILNRPDPKTIDDSRFSIQHILAYQLVYGKCDLDTCSEKSLADDKVIAARSRVHVISHNDAPLSITAGDGDLEVTLTDGRKLERSMEQPYGAPMYPLTTEQVVDIYRMYCDGVMSPAHIDRTLEIILGLDKQADLQELYAICTDPMQSDSAARKVSAHA
jgi:2-methylcitrate dehydratase PrpD